MTASASAGRASLKDSDVSGATINTAAEGLGAWGKNGDREVIGRADVLFYDRRADPANVMTEVYLEGSADRGASFIQRSLSATGFSSQVGPSFGEVYGTDFGIRLGLISYEHGAVGAWTDTRFGWLPPWWAWFAANSLGSQGRQQP